MLLRHIPGLKKIDGVTLVSVCNRSRASSEKIAREHGIATIYDDWRELVNADDTDAVFVGTWPYLHCPATLAALAAGKARVHAGAHGDERLRGAQDAGRRAQQPALGEPRSAPRRTPWRWTAPCAG